MGGLRGPWCSRRGVLVEAPRAHTGLVHTRAQLCAQPHAVTLHPGPGPAGPSHTSDSALECAHGKTRTSHSRSRFLPPWSPALGLIRRKTPGVAGAPSPGPRARSAHEDSVRPPPFLRKAPPLEAERHPNRPPLECPAPRGHRWARSLLSQGIDQSLPHAGRCGAGRPGTGRGFRGVTAAHGQQRPRRFRNHGHWLLLSLLFSPIPDGEPPGRTPASRHGNGCLQATDRPTDRQPERTPWRLGPSWPVCARPSGTDSALGHLLRASRLAWLWPPGTSAPGFFRELGKTHSVCAQ